MPASGNSEEVRDARASLDRRLTAAMAAAQGGDRAAYELVLRECVPMIRRIARHGGVPPDSLDDVVQDVLITIHGARATFDPSRSFSAWLTAIAQRRSVDLLRRHIRRGAREVHAPVAFENFAAVDNPEGDAVRQGEATRLHGLVAQLPEGQREAVQALALEENSLEDASKSTGRTKTSLKVNLHRAIKSLRSRLGGET
jgi:RNA polymerase sigma-70 factor (ECF subfamily)